MAEEKRINPNPYENLKKIIDQVASILKLDASLTAILKTPFRIYIRNFPVPLDNGEIKVFTGYRVHYRNSYGKDSGAPVKGGLRYHPNVNLDEIIALSGWMFFKVEVVNLPFGGAKGGIQCNPKEMSKAELERMTRAFTCAFADVFDPYKDVPAPDVYTNPQVMAWILDEYSKLHPGQNNFGVVTGKPVELKGSLGRLTATGRGGDFVLEYAVETNAVPSLNNLEGKTCIIQGYGNVGQPFANFAVRRGIKVIAVSDTQGGIYMPNGIDLGILDMVKARDGSVIHYPNAQVFNGDKEALKILEIPCDILVPAALENQITSDNADRINAKVIVELANGPTTPEADEILFRKGIVVLPDILANAGGVTVSYFEWAQNVEGRSWTEQEVDEELRRIMRGNAEEVISRAKKHQVNNRLAAYILAIERAAKRMTLRGLLND